MFEMIENYNNREYVNTANENITIEHIFPQNPNEDWSKNMTPDDFFQFREKYVDTIANLTLSGNNGALSNKSFTIKKQMNNKDGEQGYVYSRLWLNAYLKTIDAWNIENYKQRFELIYARFLKIWEFPDVVIPDSENAEEQNIFNAEAPRHKKLEYFIFENTKIEEDHISQMYFHIIEKLYEKNPQLLLDSKDVLKISRSAENFRNPQELQNGYYIEANMDSNSKFSILKKLLFKFELEEDLVIKYADIESRNSPNRFNVRKEFWKQLLPQIKNTELFAKVNPSKDHWLSIGAGKGGVNIAFVVTTSYVRIELAIVTSIKERNKRYFKSLYNKKAEIEAVFGNTLEWEELPDNKMSRIKYELTDVNLYEKTDWEKMSSFLIMNLPKFEQALKEHILKLK